MKGFVFIFLQSIAIICAAGSSPSEQIITEFEGPAILTSDQLRVVQQLALRAGLPSVGKVYTYNIHPGPSFGIGVISKETIDGRERRTSCLLIGYEKWEPGGSKRQKVDFRIGDFWVYPGVERVRSAMFSSLQGDRRIGLSERTSLKVADKVFALFEAGKLRFKDPNLKKEVDDWRSAEFTLTSITWEAECRGSLGIAVRDRHAGMSLECTLQDGWITVIEVNTWIS